MQTKLEEGLESRKITIITIIYTLRCRSSSFVFKH